MDKIIICNNKLVDYRDGNIEISNNKIRFISNGEYVIDLINSNIVNLDIEILDNIDIKLFIFSRDNNIVVNNHYVLGDSSNLTINKFYYNKGVNESIVVDLNGKKSSINYKFSSI